MGAQAASRSSAKGRPVGTDWLIRIAPLAAWGMRALTSKNLSGLYKQNSAHTARTRSRGTGRRETLDGDSL